MSEWQARLTKTITQAIMQAIRDGELWDDSPKDDNGLAKVTAE